MKKLLSVLLTLTTTCSLAACSGGRADSEYEGNYIAVACSDSSGVTLTGDEVPDFSFELLPKGKATITYNGETDPIKWINDDTTITIKDYGEDMIGTIGENTIIFENMFDSDLSYTFAKEGTDATNMELYFSEDEKKLLGSWKSYKVDTLSKGVPADSLSLTFNSDKSASFIFNGNDLGPCTWAMAAGTGYFEAENISTSWKFEGDELVLTHIDGDSFYIFTCTKQ